jgi:hypothetical protein
MSRNLFKLMGLAGMSAVAATAHKVELLKDKA